MNISTNTISAQHNKHTRTKPTGKPSLFDDMNNQEAFELLEEVREDERLAPYFSTSLKYRTDDRIKVSGEFSRRDMHLFITADLVEAIFYSNGGNAYHYYMHKRVYSAVLQALIEHNINPEAMKYRQVLAQLHAEFGKSDASTFGVKREDLQSFIQGQRLDQGHFLKWAEKQGHLQIQKRQTKEGKEVSAKLKSLRIDGHVVKAYCFTMTPGVQ